MTRSDDSRRRPDVPYLPAGPGMAITWRCLGCDQPRTPTGAKGGGIRKRCAVCVAKKEERA